MQEVKECPICKTTLFSDMDTCYGCMYKFGSNLKLEGELALAATQMIPKPVVNVAASALDENELPELGLDEPDAAQIKSAQPAPLALPAQSEQPASPEPPAQPAQPEQPASPEPPAQPAQSEQPTQQQPALRTNPEERLLGEFLVEFSGFLRKFVDDFNVNID